MKPEIKNALRSYSAEVIIYAGLVAVYYFLVLHFLGDWLADLYAHERRLYAAIATSLIIGQGYLLELLTRGLLNLFRSRTE